MQAQGAPTKTVDLFHSFGLTISHQWSVRALKTISVNEMETIQQWVHQFPFVLTHDNIHKLAISCLHLVY